ncbi:hypothetical protein ACJZ2D_000639 [Fusarium nematophilum]
MGSSTPTTRPPTRSHILNRKESILRFYSCQVSLESPCRGIRAYPDSRPRGGKSRLAVKGITTRSAVMAEALGVAASAIAVVGAAIKITETILDSISQFRSAPAEIDFLHHEVADTQLILTNINENMAGIRHFQHRLGLSDSEEALGNPETIHKAGFLLKRLEMGLLEIDTVLKTITRSRSSPKVIINQATWILHRSKIKSLRQELRELKDNVALHFSASACTQAGRSIVLLTKVLSENEQNVRRQSQRNDQLDERLQNLAQRLATLSSVPERQAQLITLIENLSLSAVTLEQRSSQTTTTTTTTTAGDQLAQVSNEATATGSATGSAISDSSKVITASSATVSTESVSKLKLEFSRFQKRGCVLGCECHCHQRRRYRSPSFAQRVLGEAFIGFSSLPLLSRPCDEGCMQRSGFSLSLTYYLPTAFLSKMVSLVFMTTTQGDPAMCLKVRPLNTDFSIYRAVEKDDIRAVQSMLDQRLAHPSATFKGGWTPLHYAINYGHTAIIKSLLAVGADPLIEDGRNQLSPLEWAWTRILGGSYDDATRVEMEQLFSDRDCVEEMRFPQLHRIILGLDGSSLEAYLLRFPGSVNSVDASGRTALSWAAQRGMTCALNTLLRCGADPNINTPNGHSPLMYASEARNPDGLRPLLDAGADVAQSDIEGQTALHYAACHRRDLAYYRPLIEHGSDPNWPTIPRLTPLTTVIIEGHNEAMKYLVDNGADVNLKSHEKRSPGFYAVEYNNHGALEFLHEQGVDFKGYSTAYPSIVHVAAHHADVRTLRILTAYRLTLEDVDCVDPEGLAVPQIVEQRIRSRSSVEADFAQAFSMFLQSVIVEGLESSNSESDGEVFYDAVEEI